MTGDQVAAQPVSDFERSFQINPVTCFDANQRRLSHCFRHNVSRKPIFAVLHYREANAVNGNAVAQFKILGYYLGRNRKLN